MGWMAPVRSRIPRAGWIPNIKTIISAAPTAARAALRPLNMAISDHVMVPLKARNRPTQNQRSPEDTNSGASVFAGAQT
jgi:hypothetical protein